MEKQEHLTKKDQRIRLKSDGQDRIYEYATAGSEGWARKHKFDDMGYPMILVEWDRDHWTYNGEPDRWALEAHFDPIQEKTMEEKPKMPKELADAMSAFLENWMSEHQPQEEKPEEKKSHDILGTSSKEEFDTALKKAVEYAEDADSFILIAVKREELPDEIGPALAAWVINSYQHADSGLLLETYLSRLANASHEELALHKIKEMYKDSE